MSTKNAYLFNKLEQLRKSAPPLGIEVLNKRAKAKYSQEPLLNALIKLNTPLKKQYINSLECASVLNNQGEKITSIYCGNRFCKICNRIRTGKLINGYSEQLMKLNDPQFLTLTVKNVPAENLRSTIKDMRKKISLIQDNRRKQKLPLIVGVRKLECTYNVDEDTYHPHFHFIMQSEVIAKEIINEWLIYNPGTVIEAQKTEPATDCIELFKYFTKLTSSAGKKFNNGSKLKDEWHYPEAINQIFLAISHLRIIQPMGGLKCIKDDITDIEAAIIVDETVKKAENIEVYFWNVDNWYDPGTGELISSFKPTKNLSFFREKIRYLQKNTT